MPGLTSRQKGKRHAVKESVKLWIRQQNLRVGDPILSQNQFAEMLGTSAVTVHKALRELSEEGVVRRQKGLGTFVGPAGDGRKRLRELCLVLPGANLDRPEVNPDYWPYVQHLYREILEAVSDEWSFSTRVVAEDADPAEVAGSFARYDAVLMHYSQVPTRLIRHLVTRRIAPVIKLGTPGEQWPCLTVDHEPIPGVRAAVAFLVEHGYRRIGFIGSEQWWGTLHFQGYQQGLEAFGLSVDASRVVRVGETRREGFRGAAVLLSRGMPCDAVYVDADIRALGVIDCLSQEGVRVPEDVGVMGYDGLDYAVHHPPYLASVRIPYREMIRAALREAEQCRDRVLPRKHLSFIGPVLPGRTVTWRSGPASPGRWEGQTAPPEAAEGPSGRS